MFDDDAPDPMALMIPTEEIEPFDHHLLIRPIEPDRTTPGGLVVPDTARAECPRAQIVAAGPYLTVKEEPTDQVVAVGDRILYQPSGSIEVTVNGEKLQLIERWQIVGIIRVRSV